MASTVTLSNLPIGRPARVVSIEDNYLSVKLLEMGLLPGERVVLEHIAPFGDPIAITVGEYQMCLRLADANKVHVTPESI